MLIINNISKQQILRHEQTKGGVYYIQEKKTFKQQLYEKVKFTIFHSCPDCNLDKSLFVHPRQLQRTS